MAKKVEKKPARKRKPAAKKVVAKKVAQPRIPAWARSLRTDQNMIVRALDELAGMVDDLPPLTGDGDARRDRFIAAVKALTK